ncbi:MAG: hypothetical protein JRG94_16990 [Deltaproteobacteria bacterium]|nr:hypothetical protein [Deltaproteobacteria bacterium]MBW2293989.1 hypothetical protein [Deltaproteobacteria bacterium]
MDSFIECVGDPRAMGHCQGLAHRAAIQANIAALGFPIRRSRLPSLFALTSGSELGGGTGREVIRHYTHLAERMAGIARSADVPFSSLMKLFCTSTNGAAAKQELLASAVAVGAQQVQDIASGPLVLRTLAGSSTEESPWILRKSRPEVGFASAEITLPWLATAVAGINQAGVAVAMAPRSESYAAGIAPGAVDVRHAPHAVLLVQECLQRFEDLAGCLDWCSKRPRSGNVSLIIADAEGRLARVEIEGFECRIVEPDAGFAIDGASVEIDRRLRNHYLERQRIDLDAMPLIGDSAGDLAVWLEPARRNLSIRSVRESGSAGKTLEVAL